MLKNLAYDMRPRTIDEVVGQEHLTEGKGIIKRMVDANRLQSLILRPTRHGENEYSQCTVRLYRNPF